MRLPAAGWDEELLASELAELSAAGFDLALTGFSDDELADLRAMPIRATKQIRQLADLPKTPTRTFRRHQPTRSAEPATSGNWVRTA